MAARQPKGGAAAPVVPDYDTCPGYLLVTEADPSSSSPKTRKLRSGTKINLKADQWLTWTSKIKLDDYSVMSGGSLEKAWAHLTTLPRVRAIKLEGLAQDQSASLGDPALSSLDALPELEELTLFLVTLSQNALERLGRLPNLKSLEISGGNRLPEGLGGLRGFPALRSLRLSFGSLGAHDGETLRALPRLERLVTYKVTWAGGGSPAVLWQALGSLRELSLGDCDIVDSASLPCIARMTSLARLELESIPSLSDADVAHLAGHPTLERLSLALNPGLTDACLKTIASLPKLRSLSLRGIKSFTDQGVLALAQAPSLEEVSLSKGADAPHLSAAGIAALRTAAANPALKVHGWM
jgi:hypothetical protein